MRIEVYSPSRRESWDAFVRRSKNGTFLFFRDYMEYHGDRLVDHSLLLWDDKAELIALLPANRRGADLESHAGLTYGGFVTDERMKVPRMLEVFRRTLEFLRAEGFRRLVYKTVPSIYHRVPAEEDRYALFRCGARLYRRDVLTVAVPSRPVGFQERRRRSLKKAAAAGVTWGPSEDFDRFWAVLEDNLWTAHRVRPVHTAEEMRRLRAAFPDNIKLFCAFVGGEVVAGTVIYETETVAHVQYMASSERGRACGALDLIFAGLLTGKYRAKPYFDFGISTEDEGRRLNEGLIAFKEGFGGRAVVHDFYEIDLTRWASPSEG